MRTFLIGMMLGVIAGVLYAPTSGTRTRSIIKDRYNQKSTETHDLIDKTRVRLRDRYDELSTQVQEQAGPLKEKMVEMKEDMKSRLSDVRVRVGEKVGQMKEAYKEEQKPGQEDYRQSA